MGGKGNTVQVRLLKPAFGVSAGRVACVEKGDAAKLVADGGAAYVNPGDAANGAQLKKPKAAAVLPELKEFFTEEEERAGE